MSELGNIEKSYGKQINIAVANTNGTVLEHSTALPGNCIIVTSPVNSDLTDKGVQSLFVTDINGTPVRLTYCMQPGNGLVANDDTLYLNIDKTTITDNNGLQVALQNLIDNKTIIIENNKLHIDTQALDSATSSVQGIVMYDNNSIKKANDVLYIETANLDKANNSQYGIVTSDNDTTSITDNGVLSVNIDNLQKASASTFGVCKIDNSTLSTTNSIVSVDTDAIQKISDTTLGVAKVDGTTITSTDGVLSVVTKGLTQATNINKGTVKIDTNTLDVTDGVISVKNYDNLISTFNEYKTLVDTISTRTTEISDLIDTGEISLTDTIYSLTCDATTVQNLVAPSYQEEPKNMKMQEVYVVLYIICNCDFTIDVNTSAKGDSANTFVELTQINYNDEFSYKWSEGLLATYPSTKMKQKRLVFLFNCKNFARSADPKGYIIKDDEVKITFTIASANDKTINKVLKYSIIGYNSLYKKDIGETIESEKNTVKMYVLQDSSTWLTIN